MVKNRLRHNGPYGLALLALIFVGCASGINKDEYYRPIEIDLRAGQYQNVVDIIEKAREEGTYKEKDRFLYYLDAGLAYHYASQFDSSNLRLSVAEQAAEELFTKSISKGIFANSILSDFVTEYPGEDHEVLYTNLIMALNYLEKRDFDGAFVEIRRANDKLDLLEQKYVDAEQKIAARNAEDTAEAKIAFEAGEIRFNSSAFARYLSMHIYAADGLYDDARIDYDALHEAFILQPQIYNFDPPEVAYHSDSDAILSVISLAGLSPIKDALNLRVRTDENLNLLTVQYDDDRPENTTFANFPLPDNVGDFYAKLTLPQLVDRPSSVASIRVTADSMVLGELQLIEDIGAVARATYEARQSLTLWRTVVRVVLKTIAASKIKNKIDDGGIAGWLGKLATDVAYDLSEKADLRGAVLLPDRVYVGDFEIPPGTYKIRVEYLDPTGAVVDTRYYTDINVRPNDFNMLRSVCLR